MIKKNDEIIVDIIDNGLNGEGIAKVDGLVIFVPNSIKNEKVKIRILKVTSKIAYSKVLDIIKCSEYRKNPNCDTYSKCGGCSMRHIDYEYTTKIKKELVENTIRKSLGYEVEVDEFIKMDNPVYYRNKLQYPIRVDDSGNIITGIYAINSHRVIENKNCLIQDKISQDIVNDIVDFMKENNISAYDENKNSGLLRNVVIRVGEKTNEIMVTLVLCDLKLPKQKELVDFLISKYNNIVTIIKNLNKKDTNVILGDKNEVIYGNGYMTDLLLSKKFKISNMSFYQVNPIQTEKLYSKAIEYASLNGNETIFDLYCGIGTIGICASDFVKNIVGIETIPEAIENAKENAQINNVNNFDYYVGNVEDILPKIVQENNVDADVVFIDPPRKGCEKEVLYTLLNVMPKKIIYISCNPATLARDLKILEEKYNIEKIACVDMFPWTGHLEVIVCLNLKG